jgi:hypothetical protein
MPLRRPHYVVTLGLLVALSPAVRAAQVRTQNFLVDAPDQQTAQQFGQMAEKYRKEKALDWLGREMEPWPRPCPLRVKVTMGGAGGATKFNYDFRGNYEIISMEIEGDYSKMLYSVLPHEVTHTVFAHHFRYPVPRWADEGGSVLSENDAERQHHDKLVRGYLNHRQGIQLRRLFTLKEYGEIPDVMVLYAQGFSVSNYLVSLGGRQAFLGFVSMGLQGQWDKGVQTYYHKNSVEELEQAWLQNLRETKGGGAALMAQAKPQAAPAGGQLVVRQTAPPAQPQLDPAGPVARGQSDDESRSGATLTSRPAYLPDAAPPAPVAPLKVPSPPMPPAPAVPPVRLGVPEFGPSRTPGTPTSPPPTIGQGN